MLPLSTVIITLNEEKRVKETLESVKWCDEIIVLDSCSTDKTLEICKEYPNCKVFTEKFRGYGEQKRHAISLASNNWILSIDADEVVTEELQLEIRNTLNENRISDISGFEIPITLVFLGKIFNYGRENRMPHLRLFNRNFGNFNDTNVHEEIKLTGRISCLKGQILHNSFEDLHHYFEKFNEYTTKLAVKMEKTGRKISRFSVIIRFPFDFLKLYFVYGNFLNGYAGFVWSTLSTFYRFVKFNKYFEMKHK